MAFSGLCLGKGAMGVSGVSPSIFFWVEVVFFFRVSRMWNNTPENVWHTTYTFLVTQPKLDTKVTRLTLSLLCDVCFFYYTMQKKDK